MAQFINPYDGQGSIEFSPDRHYFVVITERGLIAQNRPEDTISIWETSKVRAFANHPTDIAPKPAFRTSFATYRDGPIVGSLRWTDNSRGLAFLARTARGGHQLFKVTIRTRSLKNLTPTAQDVTAYEIVGENLIYTALSEDFARIEREKARLQARDITGEPLIALLFPSLIEDRRTYSDLWAQVGGKRFQIIEKRTRRPLHTWVNAAALGTPFALSPDARTLVLSKEVASVPEGWTRYRLAPDSPWVGPISPGKQQLDIDNRGDFYARSLVLVNVRDGSTSALTDAPTGRRSGFLTDPAFPLAQWSPDGRSLILRNTYLSLSAVDDNERAEREAHPCVAVVRLATHEISCVRPMTSRLDGIGIGSLRFDPADDRRIELDDNKSYLATYFASQQSQASGKIYTEKPNGGWFAEPAILRRNLPGVDVHVQQSLNEPPVLVVSDPNSNSSRIVWDPNPQLKTIDLGEATVMSWKDSTGFVWEAGLIKPPDFVGGKRYPLVIQTHGFQKNLFLSHGSYSTGFAARELAANGIVVLQMPANSTVQVGPKELPSQVIGFENAIKKLDDQALIDPERVGIIGFSRTVSHTLAALTTSHLFSAASIIDGVNFGYYEYVSFVDFNNVQLEGDSMMTAAPFGPGLQQWLSRSPEFNMDKVTAPLLIMAPGAFAVFAGWEPYAALRRLHKPVDLVLLHDGTHVETNPQQRVASQSTNIDWFRFWLQGYEDHDPAKAAQYGHWRELRKLRDDSIRDGRQSGAVASPRL